MSQKSVVRQITREATDFKTGEVRATESCQVFSLQTESPYVKLYVNDLGAILQLPEGARSLLLFMTKSMDFEGICTLNKSKKDRISKVINCTDRTIRNNLVKLCKANAIRQVGTGEYELNPNYFAKGDMREIMRRQKDFAMTVTYTKEGTRDIKTDII